MIKYDSYKDSGVDWIGEIPLDWRTSQFKFYIHLRHGYQFREYDFTDSGIKIVKITQLHRDGFLDISNCSTIDENRLENFNNILIKKNDILMCLTGGTIGKIIRVGDINEPLLQNYRVGHFSSLNKSSISDNYLFYLMSSEVIVGQIFYDVKETGQPNIGLEDMNRMNICIPPIQEQQQIVFFLDTKITLIDSLIEKTKKKIELLKENRTSLINQVVTKGLNPNVEMKDSGVEWIGEIPSHWDQKRVKNLTNEHRQGFYTNKPYDNEGFRVVRITDLNDDRTIDVSNSPFYSISEDDKIRFLLRKGDILFPRTGGVGRFGIFNLDVPSIYGSFLIRFRFSSELSLDFLKYYFDSPYYLNQILKEIHGGVNQNVHVENIKECGIIFPSSTNEQQQIVEYLDEQTEIIDTTITKEQKRIKLLKEYRQSLISEVVTGKIKVTNE